MSRIGNAAVVVPNGVDVTIAGLSLTVKGPKGTLSRVFPTGVSIAREENTIVVTRDNEERDSRARHGLVRTLVNNMMIGVTEGYTKELDIIGVGYRAANTGKLLELTLGYSHPILFMLPDEINLETKQDKGGNPTIIMECIDKQLLGQVSAKIRGFRKPEPYKGKGVKFVGEVLRRKAGKSA